MQLTVGGCRYRVVAAPEEDGSWSASVVERTGLPGGTTRLGYLESEEGLEEILKKAVAYILARARIIRPPEPDEGS